MKHFIKIQDISKIDLRKIINDAKRRKKNRKNLNTLIADKDTPLKGKLLVQMFEKSSLRTRISFYLAIRQLGGSTLTLRPDELHLNKGGESISDTSKILSTYGDAFLLRTNDDRKLELFKKNSSVPIINGLSPNSHPAQILSDIFTIEELKKKSISKLKICWVGDINNVLNSLAEASIKLSFPLNIACPKNYNFNKNLSNWINCHKNKIKRFYDPIKAIKQADAILTDKIISMNDNVNKKKKLNHLKNLKLTKA